MPLFRVLGLSGSSVQFSPVQSAWCAFACCCVLHLFHAFIFIWFYFLWLVIIYYSHDSIDHLDRLWNPNLSQDLNSNKLFCLNPEVPFLKILF